MIAALLLSACGTEAADSEKTDTTSTDERFSFTDRELDASYDESSAEKIDLSSQSGDVTISKEGTYILTGELDGCITVALGENDKAQIVLDGVSVESTDTPAISISSGDKVFLTLAEGSENTLSDGDSRSDESLDATIFSRADLCINGGGALSISGNYKHAVVSKDDLVITGGAITATAQNVALCGKDCVKICSAELSLTAGTDGIRSDNTEDADRGYVYIKDGSLDIASGTDGIQAETVLKIDGGTLDIVSGEGSANASFTAGGMQNPDWGMWGNNSTDSSDEDSAKGLKSGVETEITGGTITVDSSDDSVHSNGTISITGGELSLSSGDDGVHADTELDVSGGTVTVSKSYEGLESALLNISGGTIDITASDDGLNAAGGADSSSVNDRPGQNGFSSSTGDIVISGGYTVIDASGDGIDSNGTISVTGGVTLVSGPTDDGNCAFDYETSASVTGGIVVALGSSGMAENFTEADNQGAILCSFTSQTAGTSFALTDSDGSVVASFTPAKAYCCVTITAPAITSGSSYSIVCGGTVSDADENGFADSGTVSGGTAVTEIEMSDSLYSNTSGGMGGGMTQPNNMGGDMGGGMAQPDGFGGGNRPN